MWDHCNSSYPLVIPSVRWFSEGRPEWGDTQNGKFKRWIKGFLSKCQGNLSSWVEPLADKTWSLVCNSMSRWSSLFRETSSNVLTCIRVWILKSLSSGSTEEGSVSVIKLTLKVKQLIKLPLIVTFDHLIRNSHSLTQTFYQLVLPLVALMKGVNLVSIGISFDLVIQLGL